MAKQQNSNQGEDGKAEPSPEVDNQQAEAQEKPQSAKAARGEVPDFLRPDYDGPIDTRQAKRRLAFKQSAEGRKLYADHEKQAKQ